MREITEIIMKINDLQKANPGNQRLRDGSPNAAKKTTDGTHATDEAARLGPCVHFTVPFVPLIDSFIIHHGNDFTPVRQNQKTYRRLFGMIFFGGFESMLVTTWQRLATQKILKNRQNTKAKYHFYFAKHRFSCQNAGKKACFFCQY
jgi:hypothetical protein